MISLRLPAAVERQLDWIAKQQGRTRSAVLKDSILEYIAKNSPPVSAYELGEDLFGSVGSGDPGLAENRKSRLFGRKHEKRRPH